MSGEGPLPASQPGPAPAPRDHRLTLLLREALAAATGHTTMIAHVSDAPARYAETLSTAQLAARVHRLRRKKVKVGSPLRLPRPAGALRPPGPAQSRLPADPSGQEQLTGAFQWPGLYWPGPRAGWAGGQGGLVGPPGPGHLRGSC